MIENLTYAGIGSRETPEAVCEQMAAIAKELWALGYTLRSGGAHGADTAFETGANGRSQIFRPHHVTPQALDLAARFHPRWEKCSDPSRLLLARNGFQVLGADLKTPSKFVICWTKDGGPSGGTGQALRIAAAYAIPVFNMHDPEAGRRAIEAASAFATRGSETGDRAR